MATQPAPASFTLAKASAALSLTALVLGLIAYWAVPAAFGDPPHARAAVLWSTGLSWLIALAAVTPAALLRSSGVVAITFACFGGAALRLVLSLLAIVILVKSAHLPGGPVAVTMLALYLPLLGVEVAFVGRHLWKRDWTPKPAGSAGQGPTEVAA